KAMRAVLPKTTRLIAVGGVGPGNIHALKAAGCDGFGIGSTLYKPGDAPAQVSTVAHELVAMLGKR
ncbi:MAG: 2-dehydro-3-deoxy-6-phosphogalactonate aldolase, partial [Bosea sp. (in: a-proteobacteria)]